MSPALKNTSAELQAQKILFGIPTELVLYALIIVGFSSLVLASQVSWFAGALFGAITGFVLFKGLQKMHAQDPRAYVCWRHYLQHRQFSSHALHHKAVYIQTRRKQILSFSSWRQQQ